LLDVIVIPQNSNEVVSDKGRIIIAED